MKTQKNSKLEKILSSVKETIKGAGARAREIAGSTRKFFKDNYRVGVMLGAGLIGGYVGEKANGGEIELRNKGAPANTGIMYIKKISGATENYNNFIGGDSDFINNPSGNRLGLFI